MFSLDLSKEMTEGEKAETAEGGKVAARGGVLEARSCWVEEALAKGTLMADGCSEENRPSPPEEN